MKERPKYMYEPLLALSYSETKLKKKLSNPGVLPNTLYGLLDKLNIQDTCASPRSALTRSDIFTLNLQSLVDKGHLTYTRGNNGKYIFELKDFTP